MTVMTVILSVIVVSLVTQVTHVLGDSVHSPVLGLATQVRRDFTVYSHNKLVCLNICNAIELLCDLKTRKYVRESLYQECQCQSNMLS